MTQAVFTLQQIPGKKWRLTQKMIDKATGKPFDQDRGIYDNPGLAHEAIKIILSPVYYYYDANGDEIR